MKNYTAQIKVMRQLLDNIEFHINYNHPTEASAMLDDLLAKVDTVKTEVESDE